MRFTWRMVRMEALFLLGLAVTGLAQASLIPPKSPPTIITECGVPARAYVMTEHGLFTYTGSAAKEIARTVNPMLWVGTVCRS